ncbi:MAG: LysM peptidoglycan-binding domain-containing protein [Firmicutes bacterium]|nr:LysM peptidoglycan-binding domain-containing protein [Bacillota bacterium]
MGWEGKKITRRVLRFGDNGADVRRLQDFLSRQGYDLGEEERYGYLTRDAVSQFQREHGLRVDGIAGPQFFDLIRQKGLPSRRRVHLVQPGETLESIAGSYGLDPGAFGCSNRLKQIYPGRRLVFFDREVWGISKKTIPNFPRDQLTGLIALAPNQRHSPLGIPCIAQADLKSEDEIVQIHELLRNRKRRERAVEELFLKAEGASGIYLPWQKMSPLDGRRYLSFLRMLIKKLKENQLLLVELGPGIPQWKVWGGLDYGRVNRLSHRIVLRAPIFTHPQPVLDRNKMETLLNSLGAQVYPWKILLRIPVFAVEWELTAKGAKWTKLSYAAALSRVFRFGARLKEDGRGRPFYSFRRGGSEFQLYLPSYNVLGEVLALINLYNLAGVILDSLGQEDPRFWGVLSSYFRSAQL